MTVGVKSVAAVIEGNRVLVREAHEPAIKSMAFSFIGSPLQPGENVEACLHRVVKEVLGVTLMPVRLLYVHENLWLQDKQDHQEIAFYFLCRVRGGIETNSAGEVHSRDPKVHLKLVPLEELDTQRLYPPALRKEFPRDMRTGFKEGVKHLLDDQRAK